MILHDLEGNVEAVQMEIFEAVQEKMKILLKLEAVQMKMVEVVQMKC